ncbi:LLM class flavin-dependent oxidoreductase [Frondihabitans australicus]|uniref:Putative LLM family oxidoreductase n=1 Tax=Frondihabitans australicus TaxID=386892 RepID=A0A495IJA1_9MICO|nr:LLM class flavin-dependent oxidoreductase [Frondihabitans australicus]RKR76053.1 putative LLM family oxidoreductase [Frondihabitans australicus]
MATASNPDRVVPVVSPDDVELGLDTFGDVTESPTPGGEAMHGELTSHAETIRQLLSQAVLADEVGLDFFGVGEHHRADFAVSAPEVVLGAIAAKTSRIHVGSAVTVLSSDDPVRVFERFSTVDALSSGRAEVVLGRGSFTESFPLFGLDLADYEVLFEEKINLFAELLKDQPVTWNGTTRGALHKQEVFPRPESGTLKTWVGVGGSPQSVIRAAHYGMGLFLAIIGGQPAQFAPYADLYRRALEQMGHGPRPIAMHSPGFVAATDEEALETLYPYQSAQVTKLGRERGWPPFSREQYLASAAADGALYVGSPETVARKITQNLRVLGATRFDMKYSMGPLPHDAMMRSIELYGTKVAPMVRELLAEAPAPVAL